MKPIPVLRRGPGDSGPHQPPLHVGPGRLGAHTPGPRPPAAGALAWARIARSAAQLPGAGKLASVVTITNSIVLSRAPANKVIH